MFLVKSAEATESKRVAFLRSAKERTRNVGTFECWNVRTFKAEKQEGRRGWEGGPSSG